MIAAELLPRESAALLAAWVLTYALHSTLFLGAASLVARRGMVRTPHALDVLWKAAMVGGLLTATVQLAVGVRPWGGQMMLGATRNPVDVTPSPVVVIPSPVAVIPSAARDLARATPTPAPGVEASAGEILRSAQDDRVASTPMQTPLPPAEPRGVSFSLSTVLLLAWAAIAGVLLARLLIARALMGRRMGRRERVTDPALLAMLDDLRLEMDVVWPVRLTRAGGLSSPVALGLREICLPDAALTELDSGQQRGVLAHELAHLVRRDPLWLLFGCLLERALFFQPLNRMARRRLQEVAEYVCDDWAARRTGSGLTVAKSLVKVAEWLEAPPPVPLAGMAESRSQLLTRVQRLIEGRSMSEEPRRRWLPVAVLVLLLLAAAVVPGVTTAQRQEPAQRPGDSATPAPSAVESAAPARGPGRGGPGRVRIDVPRALEQARAVLAGQPPKLAAAVADVGDLDVSVSHKLEKLDRKDMQQGMDSLQRNAAVLALIEALKDPSAQVRQAAAQSLGRLEDKRATEPLIRLASDPVAEVRRAAVDALKDLEDPRAFDTMVAALRDSDTEVRRMAADALGNFEDPRAAAPLAAALKDPDAEVRANAADALGDLELTTAPQALVDALKDGKADVRRNAANALENIHDPRTVPALKTLLDDPDADVREHAVNALGEIRDGAAIDALIGAMKSKDPVVRRAAADALGKRD